MYVNSASSSLRQLKQVKYLWIGCLCFLPKAILIQTGCKCKFHMVSGTLPQFVLGPQIPAQKQKHANNTSELSEEPWEGKRMLIKLRRTNRGFLYESLRISSIPSSLQ